MEQKILKFLYTQINKSIRYNSEVDTQTFERADKIIIWIVGFSIGIFVLLFKSYECETSINNLIPTKTIAIISLIVIILGLIFRIVSFYTVMLLNNIISSFSSYTDFIANAPELLENEDFESQINEYKTQVAIHFGLSQESMDVNLHEKKNKIRGKRYRMMLLSSYIFFSLTIGTFILGVIIILIKLLPNM